MKKKIKAEEYSKWNKNLYKEDKELTPLEAWEEIKDAMLEWTEGYEENFDIIETALKRLEKIDNSPKVILGRHQGQTKSMIDYVCKNWKEVKITNLEDENKLKAFEIIKENFKLESCYGKVSLESKKEMPQEEYDLLKEIL